jgi:hypothetical protein
MTIVELIERERRQIGGMLVAAVWGLAAAATALVLAAGVLLLGGARWLSLPRFLPLLVWVAALGACAAIAFVALRRVRVAASSPKVAAAVEQERALRLGSVRGVLEVADSGPYGRLAAERLVAQLGPQAHRLAPRLRKGARNRGMLALGALIVGVVALSGFARSSPDGWQAVVHPFKAASGTLLPPLAFENAPVSVLRGEGLSLRISAEGRREISVARRSRGSAWVESTLQVRNGVAAIHIPGVDAAQQFVAMDGRTVSDTLTIALAERPFVGDIAVHAVFPAYLRRAAEPLAAGEPLRIPRGTVLLIEGHSSSTLRSVSLQGDGARTVFPVDDRRFSGRLAAEKSGRWEWSAEGIQGPILDLPAPVELDVIPDSAPRIEFVSPATDTSVTPSDRVLVALIAADDHGIGSASLNLRLVRSGREARTARIALAANAPMQWAGSVELDLTPLRLVPGDEVRLRAEATDNSPWAQKSASRELILRVPGLSERRSDARALADSTIAAASATAAAQRELQQRTSEAARSRNSRQPTGESGDRENSMSYESAEQAKSLAKEQRELAARVQKLQSAAQELRKQLGEAGALDSSLASKLAEVQRLLNEALTPELAERLRQLEQASQRMSQNDSRQALNDLSQQQQRLREQLEKSVEMLKRAALEGAMETLKDEAREIAEQERALADSMRARREESRDSRLDPASREEARDLAERARELQRDVAQLSDRLRKEQADAGADQMKSAEASARASAEAMEQAAGEEKPDARKSEPSGERQRQAGDQRRDAQQSGQGQQGGQQQSGQQQSGQQQSGQQQSGQQGSQQGQQGSQQGENAASNAAEQMEQAAKSLSDARQAQVEEWKKELSSELDQGVMEMLQLSRQQSQLEQRVRQGADPGSMRGEQSALQQGVEKASERLGKAGQKTSLLSQRSQRSVAEARQRVEQATRSTADARSRQQTADAMRDAAESLNRAAASLVRDRDRANSASSATGFAEMMEQMQQLARQQGALNAQAAGLMPGQGQSMGAEARDRARQLAQQQRGVARALEELGDNDATGKADDLAREARMIAQVLEAQGADPATIERQQRLFRRMLDAGRTLEQDERDDTGKRESRPGTQDNPFVPPSAEATGKAATKFRQPDWNELRGLSAEERRLIIEYFKRINSSDP